MKLLSKYLGVVRYSGVELFGPASDLYVLSMDTDVPYFLHADGRKEPADGWQKGAIENNIKNRVWGYLTIEQAAQHFPNVQSFIIASNAGGNPAPWTDVIGQYVAMIVDNSVVCYYLQTKAVRTSQCFNASSAKLMLKNKHWVHLTNKQFSMLVPSLEPVAKTAPATKTLRPVQTPTQKIMPVIAVQNTRPLSIKKGSVYFNTTTKQVERVITIQDGSLIWTSKHKQQATPFPKSALRLATTEEVVAYLRAAGV